jgi:hypothetical protein
MNIPYSQAKGLIKEADVLLFRAGKFPSIGWWIAKYTASFYSHAALAHWDQNELYAIEFREFQGSRQYPMDKYVEKLCGCGIDVFRAADTVIYPYIEKIKDEYWIAYKEKKFDADIATSITQTALELIGHEYSYWTIWQILKTYIPFIRLRRKVIKNGEPETKNFVCSTLITYAYRKHYIDPVPFLSDEYTSPGDLARSGLFSQLFCING